MGDRANVKIESDEFKVPIYLYTHWGGCELVDVVHAAISRKARWDDPPYFTRIVFCEMVKGEEQEETGFGISTSICDNEHPIIVLNTTNKTIRLESEEGKPLTRSYSFEKFLEDMDLIKKPYLKEE